MGDLTKNLSRWEFACICGCGKDTVDFELATVLQDLVDDVFELGKLRGVISVKIHINSGSRCLQHNYDVGGGYNSQHLKGKAADFTIEISKYPGQWEMLTPKNVFMHLDEKHPDTYGMGDYEGFTHFDVRAVKARW